VAERANNTETVDEESVSPCPANLRCRNLRSIRACLTYLGKVLAGSILDFTQLQFIDPAAIVLLHHMARRYSKPVFIRLPTQNKTKNYLEDHLQLTNKGAFALKNPKAFPLRNIAKQQDLSRELGKWREMLIRTGALGEELARSFSSTMSEVLMNSFTHGRTNAPCVVAGQTFSGHSILAAVDHGLTIPHTLAQSKLYDNVVKDKPHGWLSLAIKRGVTCRTVDTNRGYGLAILTEMIQTNGGSMYIISGDAALSLEKGGDPVAEPLGSRYATFPGTFIVLDIKTKDEDGQDDD
jgi:hypothetical protein